MYSQGNKEERIDARIDQQSLHQGGRRSFLQRAIVAVIVQTVEQEDLFTRDLIQMEDQEDQGDG